MMRKLFVYLCLLSVAGCSDSNQKIVFVSENLPILEKDLSHDPSVSIRRVEQRDRYGIGTDIDTGKLTAESESIIDVLQCIYPDKTYLKAETDLPAGVYDITVIPSESKDAFELLKHEIERIFSLEISIQNLEVPVMTLIVASSNCPPDGMQVSTEHRGIRFDGKNFIDCSMQEFCESIDKYVEEPLLNRTQLFGRYDFAFNLIGIHGEPSLLTNELAKCGLDLRNSKDTVLYMVVRKKTHNQRVDLTR